MDKYLLRRYPRVKTNIPAQFISNSQLSYGKIEDISGGGIRIRTFTKLDFDSHIILYFILDDNFSLILKSRLIWRNKISEEKGVYANGVEFVNIPPKLRNQITDYVDRTIK